MATPEQKESYDFDNPDNVGPLYDIPSSEVEDPMGGEEGIEFEDALDLDPEVTEGD